MPTIDDDLTQIERDIRTLKIEYEQFFGGGRKRPPADTQWRLDMLVRRLNEQTRELNFAQRFRLNNLTQTYAKYQDFWRKKMTQRESGRTQRHFGAAAKAIEAERKKAMERADVLEATASGPASQGPVAFSFSNPESEGDKLETMYQKLLEARNETGEQSGVPSLKDFAKFVRSKTASLRANGAKEVEYTVSIEGGRVKLKARVSE